MSHDPERSEGAPAGAAPTLIDFEREHRAANLYSAQLAMVAVKLGLPMVASFSEIERALDAALSNPAPAPEVSEGAPAGAAPLAPTAGEITNRGVVDALWTEYHVYDDHREDGFGVTREECRENTCVRIREFLHNGKPFVRDTAATAAEHWAKRRTDIAALSSPPSAPAAAVGDIAMLREALREVCHAACWGCHEGTDNHWRHCKRELFSPQASAPEGPAAGTTEEE